MVDCHSPMAQSLASCFVPLAAQPKHRCHPAPLGKSRGIACAEDPWNRASLGSLNRCFVPPSCHKASKAYYWGKHPHRDTPSLSFIPPDPERRSAKLREASFA